MNLGKHAINRPVATIMIMLMIILIGVVAYSELTVDLLPDINPPVAAVITRFPGASPKEVEDLITVPVEAVAGTAAGVKDISSISQEGLSLVILMFDWGKNMSDVRADIAQKLELLKLPEDASSPMTLEFDPTMLPIMQVTVTDNANDLGRLTELVENEIKPKLEGVEGVAAVDITGSRDKQVMITLDPSKLTAYGLTQEQVAGVISASNLNYPLGIVREEGLDLQLRMLGKMPDLEAVRDLVVGYAPGGLGAAGTAGAAGAAGTAGGAGIAGLQGGMQARPGLALSPVKLRDVASVEMGYSPVTSITRINGQSGVTLEVHRMGTANTVKVAAAVRDALDDITSDMKGLQAVIGMDQSYFIELAIGTVQKNLLIGAGLAILVLLLFLRDIRATLVVAVSIPFSLIATFVFMYGGKLSLNTMTLGGLALGVGMLVDNSIVVIENIYRHIQEGQSPREAAEEGAREVAMAITASTLTTIVVFLPVVFVGGMTGIIFKELAWTVTLSLLASLLVALTVVPMLASKWFGRKTLQIGQTGAMQTGAMQTSRQSPYSRMVAWCLNHRAAVIALTLLVLGGSVYLASGIETEFMPTADEGSFSINIKMKPGTPLEDLDKTVMAVEEIVAKEKAVEKYGVSVGHSGTMGGFQSSAIGGSDAEILVTLSEEAINKKETQDVMDSVARKVEKVQGDASVTYNLTSSMMVMAGDLPSQLQVTVSGPDIAEVTRLSEELMDKMSDVEGLEAIESSLALKKPEIHIKVDKDKAMAYGLTPAQVALSISRSVKGQTVSRFESGGEVLDVIVRYDKDSVSGIEGVGDIVLSGAAGKAAVRDIASVEHGEGPVVITRSGKKLSARVTARISGRKLGAVASDVSEIISDMDVGEGYKMVQTGATEFMDQAFSSLRKAFILAAVLVYMVMAASFESLSQPLIIMLTMPLAAVGTILALLISGHAFGVTAFIGVIILAGVVVNNGIVMVDFINQQRKAGLPVTEAIVEGSANRLRPVLMTSLTTITGLIPLALGIGKGAELEAPLALSVMGGLTSGTVLTLVVIPVVYSLFAGTRRKPRVAYTEHTKAPDSAIVDSDKADADADVEKATYARDVGKEELVLGPAFDSKDMAELMELLGKLFSSVRRVEE